MRMSWESLNINPKTTVAIVGSSDNILNKGYGPEIDNHEEVVRFNRAPVVGWEEQVGFKTTIRAANLHVFGNVPFGNKRWDPIGQPTNFIKDLRNCKILYLGNQHDLPWINRKENTHQSCQTYQLKRFHLGNKLASIGLSFIQYCVINKVIPSVYGFGIGEESMTHYWEQRDNNTPYHDFNQEREILKQWDLEGKIKIKI